MALISPSLSLSPTIPSTSMSLPVFFLRLQSASLGRHSRIGQSLHIHAPLASHKKVAAMAMISGDPDESVTAGDDGESTDEEDIFGIQNLPLESKLQLKLEQKMKMNINKSIRLRRKRLMRKRMMRKKGKWPPSKMKKLKTMNGSISSNMWV